jgi:hypothetical protein
MKKTLLLTSSLFSLSIVGFCFFMVLFGKSPQTDQKYSKVTEFYEVVETDVVDQVGGGGSVEEVNVKNDYSPEAIEYFDEIVMNNEFTGRREKAYKWKTDMRIYVDGQKPEYLVSELKKIVGELNDIIDPIQIKIVSTPSQANYFIYFGSHYEFSKKYNLINPDRLSNNWGYFEVYSSRGNMYVDLYRNDDTQSHKHLLREELTQSLGLFNDSYKYPESIFYQGWTTTTEFAPIDVEIIDMLYNN